MAYFLTIVTAIGDFDDCTGQSENSGRFLTFNIVENFSFVFINSGKFFPLHMGCGKFSWGKVWWENSGKFSTTHLNSGKFHFPPSLFPTVFFSGKTVGKQIFLQNLQFFPLNLQCEIDGFLVVNQL